MAEKRKCGYCNKVTNPPHNSRTCKVKEHDEAAKKAQRAAAKGGETAISADIAAAAAAAMGGAQPAPHVAGATVVGPDQDFEEIRKHATVNGRSLTAAIRSYAGGSTQFVVRIQDEGGAPREEIYDISSAGKLWELLTWCLQQHQARQVVKSGPVGRQNVGRTQNGLPRASASA